MEQSHFIMHDEDLGSISTNIYIDENLELCYLYPGEGTMKWPLRFIQTIASSSGGSLLMDALDSFIIRSTKHGYLEIIATTDLSTRNHWIEVCVYICLTIFDRSNIVCALQKLTMIYIHHTVV